MFALFACDVGQPSTVMPDLVTLICKQQYLDRCETFLWNMRSLAEAREPWQSLQTIKSLADLKEAIHVENEPDSLTKSRSLLWKVRIIAFNQKSFQTDGSSRFSYCSKVSINQNGFNDQQIRVRHMLQCARICCEALNILKKCWARIWIH